MRFTTWTEDGLFLIRGTPVGAHGDLARGPRYQTPFDEVEMVNDTVFYAYQPGRLHPDTIAMICFNLFFPWIGHTVSFPSPASPEVARALNHATFRRFKGPVSVTNVDPEAIPYRPRSRSVVHPGDLVISFGGGVDSTALHTLFPEATLVYATSVDDPDISPRRATTEAMDSYARRSETPIFPIRTNARRISRPLGVTNWLALLIPALLVALDLDKSGVLIGSNLETMYLNSGTKYVPGHLAENPGRDRMAQFTVPIVQASGGISHLIAAKLCSEAGIIDQVTFCKLGKGGGPCSACLKCFRRETAYRCLNRLNPKSHPLESFPTDTSRYGEKYDMVRAAARFEPGKPGSNAQNLALGRDFLGDEFPEVLRTLCAAVPRVDFMWARPPEADALFPPEFHQHILARIHDRVPAMSAEDIASFRSWRAVPGA